MSNPIRKQDAGGVSVPPGFRFHPTDEELLCYYLKKKISSEPIDFDVIREVDINKLEPWDLKEKCRIGSIQDEWYFFSHRIKKYPTGTRTNRATIEGFWKATGRDKSIHSSNNERIGMRKTLVFYTGRAPRGHKTDWIMHEYRLDDDKYASRETQEWVICRVTFKKKNHTGFDVADQEEGPVNTPSSHGVSTIFDHSRPINILPHLLNRPESTIPASFLSPPSCMDAPAAFIQPEKYSEDDWLLLDRLLATDQRLPCSSNSSYHQHVFEHEFAKYSK